MPKQTVEIPWKGNPLSISLPENWELMGTLEPSPRAPVADAAAETERALNEPLGSPRLRDLVRPGARIALVIDDGSRPTPVARLLPPCWPSCNSAARVSIKSWWCRRWACTARWQMTRWRSAWAASGPRACAGSITTAMTPPA